MSRIFNIQRFSLFDGPGVRTVVFLKGCPLRCIWCHNPEGLSPSPQIMYNAERCIGCGACTKVCKKGCHTTKDEFHIFNRTNCISCGECAEAFGAYMDSTLKNIHGSNEHKGKIPHKSGGKMMLKREKELLKKQMAEAVEREDFEEAAKIRDRLRSLEKDGE